MLRHLLKRRSVIPLEYGGLAVRPLGIIQWRYRIRWEVVPSAVVWALLARHASHSYSFSSVFSHWLWWQKWWHTNYLFWRKYCKYFQIFFITTLDRLIQNFSSINSEPTKKLVNASRTTLAWEICRVLALMAIRRFIVGLSRMQSLGYLLLFMTTIFPRQTRLLAEVSPKTPKR